MKELEYPFNADEIILHKKKLRRQLLEDETNRKTIRIAILGGSTTSDIKQILELFLLNYGLKPEFYESEYNQYYQDAIFENDILVNFAPEIIYICTSNHNIITWPDIGNAETDIEILIEKEEAKFVNMWNRLKEVYRCPIIQNNFEMPYFRLLGNRDGYDIHGRTNFVMRLNMQFSEYAKNHDNFYICDINYISADYGLKNWSDPFYWYMYKYAVAVPAIPYLSFNVANIIKSLMGKNKKGFVLDLDDTLWGGVVGDDGVDRIRLGPEDAAGEAYLSFQKYLKMHQGIGIILNINSKNEYENAIAGINHVNSVFTEKDFISIKANWNPKNHNFGEIANELNLLPESLVFVDDNPAERQIVKSTFSGVQVPELADVTHYIEQIDRAGYFEVTKLSDDDLKRDAMYRKNVERVKSQALYSDYSEFLASLNMKAVIGRFTHIYMTRITQLINKSNQFNLTTKRYTQTEVEKIAENENYITLFGKLEDCFGDNGVVSVVIGHVSGDTCHIDLWLMSCRVLKRGMEDAMMDMLIQKCLERGILYIKGYYYPTAKNSMVKNFYAQQGFDRLSMGDMGDSIWSLKINNNHEKKNQYIMVEEG